jgi:putative oxidoreductase
MNTIFGLGRFLFAIPIAIFGFFNFIYLNTLSTYAPGGKASVILAGIGLLAASVSFIIRKYDKLAAVLLAVMLLLFVILLHIPGYTNAADPIDKMNAMSGMLKDLIISGASLLYARHIASDSSVVR